MKNFCDTSIAYFTATEFDPATVTLPEGFTPLSEGLPPVDSLVLAIRISGYRGAEFEILTARFMPEYRPNSPWRQIDMDSVHDSGAPVLGWMTANHLLNPSKIVI